MRTGVVLVVALLAATACGGAAGTAAGLRDELRYVRSGGIAGAHDQLVIAPDGRGSLTVRGNTEQTFNLSDQELDSVAAALERANLEDVPSDSTSAQPAPDAFSYSLSYQGKEIRTDDPSIPSDLKPLVSELDRIVAKHRPD